MVCGVNATTGDTSTAYTQRGYTMAKRLPRPEKPVRVRLDWDEANMHGLDMAAAGAGLSVASFARLSLEILVRDKSVTLAAVKAEADKLTAGDDGEDEEPAPKKTHAKKGGKGK